MNIPITPELCIVCKMSRNLCGRPKCPILEKLNALQPILVDMDRDIYGPSPPSVFVGRTGYPAVFAGPMTIAADVDNPPLYDNPAEWYGKPIDEIIRLRSVMVRGMTKVRVKNPSSNKVWSRSVDIALSVRSVDTELELSKPPKVSIFYSAVTQPMGPSGEVVQVKLGSNPKIPRTVDMLSEGDTRATTAVWELYKHGFDVYYLTRVFSAGVLGLKNKKLVPTRWSITAIDDIIGKKLMKLLADKSSINDYEVYHEEYIGNHYEILLAPGAWTFEQLEAWMPGGLWTAMAKKPVIVAENEGARGRSNYAVKEAGGYYAGRLAVLEALYKRGRIATAVILREISDEYYLPVGVWEVRETIRRAMAKPPERFNTAHEAIEQMTRRLRIPKEEWISKSDVLKGILTQTTLLDFI